MQSRKLRTLNKLILGLLLVTLFACAKDYIVPDPYVPPVKPIPPNPGDVSYSNVIQPIFTARCVVCHKKGGTAPNLSSGSSYAALWSMSLIDTVNPANSELYKEMATGGGMKQYTIKGDADSVFKWIDQGAKNN